MVLSATPTTSPTSKICSGRGGERGGIKIKMYYTMYIESACYVI